MAAVAQISARQLLLLDLKLDNLKNWGVTAAVDNNSDVLYATAGAVKKAYDLAYGALPASSNAVSASKLQNERIFTFTGDAAGKGSFDGSANLSIELTAKDSGVEAGNYSKVTVDKKGRVTGGSSPTTLEGYGITDAAPSSHVGATGKAHGVATNNVAGFMSSEDKSKLDGIAVGATNYSHPSGDGNMHVPATGTTNNGKVLKAGDKAGSLSWVAIDAAYVGALPDTGGGVKGDFWRESSGKQYGLVSRLGITTEARPNLVLLAKKYVSTFVAKTGFIGRILFDRGNASTNMRTDYVDVNVSAAYSANSATLLYRSGDTVAAAKIVEVTYNGDVYYALYRPKSTVSNCEVIVDGHSFGGGLPLLIADASAYAINDVVTTESFYHTGNKPTSSDVGLGNVDNAQQMRAVMTNGFWGLVDAAGSSSAYIRTTNSGLIPYQSGGASTLGTSSWQFNTAYAKTIYENGTSLVTKYLGIKDDAVAAIKLSTARKLTIGNTGKDFDGTSNVTWTLDDLGALPLTGGTLTGALTVPNGRGLRITSSVANPGVMVASEGGHALLWRDPTADEAAAGKSMEFIGINRASQLIFRQDKGLGDKKYTDNLVYHAGNKPTPDDVGAIPSIGGVATGSIFVDRGTAGEPSVGVRRDGRQVYLFDSTSYHGIYSAGMAGKSNVSLIRRSVATGDIDIGATLDSGGLINFYGEPRTTVAQGTNPNSLVRKDYSDAQFTAGTGGTGIGNNPLLETTTGGVRDFDLAKTNGNFTLTGGWLNGITNVGATAVTHTGTINVSQRSSDNQTVQTVTLTSVVDGIRIPNCATRVFVNASEGWSPWFKSGLYESINLYRSAIFRLNADSANGSDASYPYFTLTKEKFRNDITGYYNIGEVGFRANSNNRYDPHTGDLMVRVSAHVKPTGDEHDGRLYLASRRRDAAGGTSDTSVLALDRESGAVFTSGGRSVSINAGTVTSINSITTGDTWKESGVKRYAMTSKLGSINNRNSLVLLAKKYVSAAMEKSGFIGRILLDRGTTNAYLVSDYIDLAVSVAYQTNSVAIQYRTGTYGTKTKIVEVTYGGDVYYALFIPAILLTDVIADGHAFDQNLPLFIPDARGYTLTDVDTPEVQYHTGNKPTLDDIGAAPSGFGLGEYGTVIGTVTGNNNLRRQSGFFQGSKIAGLPSSGSEWNYVFSQAHNNAAGYFGYLAINFTGSQAWIGGQDSGTVKGPYPVMLDGAGNNYDTLRLNNWIRTLGDTGWVNETFGGGIHMSDSTYVRVYNNKRFYVQNTAKDALSTAGGITAAGAWLNGVQPPEGNALTRKDYVDSRVWSSQQGNYDVITDGWAQVGSYLFAAVITSVAVPGLNQLIAGSNLVASGAGKFNYQGGNSLPGTWRQMGSLGGTNTDSEWDDRSTLFFRVA